MLSFIPLNKKWRIVPFRRGCLEKNKWGLDFFAMLKSREREREREREQIYEGSEMVYILDTYEW
jgi:hypothetical protein